MVRLGKPLEESAGFELPQKRRSPVLFSDDARAPVPAMKDSKPHYTLHALLGENLGAGLTHQREQRAARPPVARREEADPRPELVSCPAFCFRDLRRLRGAVLVVLDPDAFDYDIRDRLARERQAGESSAWAWALSVKPSRSCRRREGGLVSASTSPAPSAPAHGGGDEERADAHAPPRAEVLFAYGMAPRRLFEKMRRGEVIFFGAQPFWDSELALKRPAGKKVLGALVDGLGIARDLPDLEIRVSPDRRRRQTLRSACENGE